jgi:hypothetical protein
VTNDPIMVEIMAAIARLQGGDRAGGRSALEAIWARIADDPAPFHACVLSHYLADAQDDLGDELAWDLRALEAALRCDEAAAQTHGLPLSIAAFMPSLQLNLADDYFQLGDLSRSREHLVAAREVIGALGDDGYGDLIRGGLARLERKLAEAGAKSS